MNLLNSNNIGLSPLKLNNNNSDILNNVNISKPQSMEINSPLLNNNKINNSYYSDKKDNNLNLRSIDFYALGKVNNNYKKHNIFIQPNNGFPSTSNNLLKRNYFSVNNRYYDYLKNVCPKKQATLYEQNINDNNYLTPINIYNSAHKYNLPSNVVNKETYNIAKEKLFANDISSPIKKGKLISKNDFILERNNFMNIKNNNYLTPTNEPLNNEKTKELKKYRSCINIKDNDFQEYQNLSHNIKKLEHSLSTKEFIPKNPKDPTKEELNHINTHFDKNYDQIVRDRNWWKINK